MIQFSKQLYTLKLLKLKINLKYIAIILIYILTIINKNSVKTLISYYNYQDNWCNNTTSSFSNYHSFSDYNISYFSIKFSLCQSDLYTKSSILSIKPVLVFTFFPTLSFVAKRHCLHGSWAATMINVTVMNIGVWHHGLLSRYPLRWEQSQSIR